jgi:hypothetical protein
MINNLDPGAVVRMSGSWYKYQTLCEGRENSSIARRANGEPDLHCGN